MYETGCLLGHDLDNKLPVNDYSEYFGPTHELQIQPSNMENQNTPEYLQGILNKILENLSKIPPKPSVPFHDVPPDAIDQDAMRVKEDPDAKGGGAEAEAARRSDPRELEPEDGDVDDKPSRHDASMRDVEDVDGGEKKVKEEKVEADAVKAELGDAADVDDPDAAVKAEKGGEGATDANDGDAANAGGPGIMASDHGDQ